MNHKVLLILPACFMLQACSMMRSDYVQPRMPSASYDFDADEQKLVGQDDFGKNFWESFSDPKLNTVILQALKDNLDLKKAALNVEKARIAADLSADDLLPTPQASLGSDAKHALSYHDSTHKSSDASFAISYQADLFGKIDAQNRSADAEFQASVFDKEAMRLSVIENTSKAYWKYAYCKQALKIAEDERKDSKQRLSIVLSRFNAGAADATDADTARISDLKSEHELDEAVSSLKQARTALNTLLGQGADKEVDVNLPKDANVPSFSLEIPSSLLSRRPDLKAYEQRACAALADADESFASFFPQFTLTAGLSSGSVSSFAAFFSNPLAALGAAVTLPFVNFHRLAIERENALNDYEIAQLDFVAAYIKAVQEVYDSVTLITAAKKALDNSRAQLKLATTNYDRYLARYRQGLSQLSDLLDAADNRRSAELGEAEAVRALLSAEATLMAATGGGMN